MRLQLVELNLEFVYNAVLKTQRELRAEYTPIASHSAIETGQVQLLIQKTATVRFDAPERSKF